MIKNRLSKTICAIITPPVESGVAIIRLSGGDSLTILKKIFFPKKQIKDFKARYMYFGEIKKENTIFDECLAVYFKSPHSFTGEDVVEFHIHGGYFNSKNILNLIIENGAIQAEKGEFSERAFLYGKIDLIQAESILEIIESRNENSHTNAIQQLRGTLSDKLKEIKASLFEIVTIIEASIDFPDEDYDFLENYNIKERLENDINTLTKLSNSYYEGKIFTKGASVAIIGSPNTGKSSLMNKLLKINRALVTDIPGTTRDFIESEFNLNGIVINLIDTAGIRDTQDIIEKSGVDLSIEKIEQADLILFLIDERGLLEDIKEIYETVKEKNNIIIQNKVDKLSEKVIENVDILVSVKQNINLDNLKELMYNKLIKTNFKSGDLMITNTRHKHYIDESLKFLNNSLFSVYERMPLELISQDLRFSLDNLGIILGEVTTEDILGNIFGNFCIGK